MNTQLINEFYTSDSGYIYKNRTYRGVYNRASKKFFKRAGKGIVLFEAIDFIASELKNRKKLDALVALDILHEVCNRVSENFDAVFEFIAPEAKTIEELAQTTFNT